MNVGNTSTEGVTEIKVENESDDEVESEIDLYTDHVIKEEMVIGPVVLQVVDVTYCSEEKNLWGEHNYCRIQNEDEIESSLITDCSDFSEWNVWGEHNYFQNQNENEVESSLAIERSDVPVPKEPKLETTDEETDQVKPEKGKKEDKTEGIISNVEFKTNSSTNIKTNTIVVQNNCYELRKCIQTPGILNYLFICNECGKRFRKKYELAEHVTGHKKKLSCSRCDIDAAVKRYACYCGYKCKQKGSLMIHIRTHTGEKPYSCSHCDYKCNQKYHLKLHTRKHTGEKPYSCSECDYKCSTKGRMAIHLRTHTGQRPYPCSYCDHKCNTKGDLSSHMRTHTGEKPYSCSHCDYKCNQKYHLQLHTRIHTGEKPYSCSECDYRTAHKKCLDFHLLKHSTPQIIKDALSKIKKRKLSR